MKKQAPSPAPYLASIPARNPRYGDATIGDSARRLFRPERPATE